MIESIHIEQLTVSAHVGVTADERRKEQRIVFNVTLSPRATVQRDEIDDTVNYSAVAAAVKEIAKTRPYKLIETLAEKVATELLGRFDIRRVAVEVRKFVLADAEYVSITAIREREPL